MIDREDRIKLTNFLESGKGLYIEGCDFGLYNDTTELYQKFGCKFISDGNYSTIGNVNNVTGTTGSITSGSNFTYLYQQEPDNYVDVIDADSGTIIFRSQDSYGRAISYGGSTNSYRAIHSSFIFGALRDGANTKEELMAIYLNYLHAIP